MDVTVAVGVLMNSGHALVVVEAEIEDGHADNYQEGKDEGWDLRYCPLAIPKFIYPFCFSSHLYIPT